MSSEHSINNKSLETPNIIDIKIENAQKEIPKRVDINVLLSKVRETKKKEKKENLVFFVLISSVVVITGIIASL